MMYPSSAGPCSRSVTNRCELVMVLLWLSYTVTPVLVTRTGLVWALLR